MNYFNFGISSLGALAIGTVLGILLAPEKGSVTRKKLMISGQSKIYGSDEIYQTVDGTPSEVLYKSTKWDMDALPDNQTDSEIVTTTNSKNNGM